MTFNAILAIAGGRRAAAAALLQRLASDRNTPSAYAQAALESGLWLALDDDPVTASEPLERALSEE